MSRALWSIEFEPYEPLRAAGNRPGGGRTHGTRSSYQAGCKDECCRRAERLYMRAYRARRAKAA